MALEELKQDLMAAEADVRSYLDNSEEYLKLKIFKIIMGMVTSAAQLILIGAISFLAIFIISFAGAVALGNSLQDETLGFIIVGLFYVIVTVVCYVFRAKLNKPLLLKFSKNYFD